MIDFPTKTTLILKINGMTRILSTFLLYVLVFFPVISQSQNLTAIPVATIFDQWYTGDNTVIDVEIKTDLSQLFRNPDKEVYQEASITTKLADGVEEQFTGKIRLRGNIRREICQNPPIKLKFKKNDLTDRGWLPHNDLKLVIPCSANAMGEQNLIAEFLTYRMYEEISPISLRVQMIKIHFVDSEEKKKDQELLAFIIEPLETLAARYDLKEAERNSYREAFLEKDNYRQMAFFQYMIGNTDWNVYNGHNLQFIGGEPFERLIPVPYDFDYSAVVGTSYAVPHESLPIKSVAQRLYRGLSCDEAEALALIEYFTEKEAAILAPIEAHPLLEDWKRKRMTRYLEGFFKQLNKSKSMVAELK